MPDTPGVPRDREARPSLDEVLALRRDRMATVRAVVDGLTDESLAARHRAGRRARAGRRRAASRSASACSIVLNEEWQHRLFAERDLDALVAADA